MEANTRSYNMQECKSSSNSIIMKQLVERGMSIKVEMVGDYCGDACVPNNYRYVSNLVAGILFDSLQFTRFITDMHRIFY